MFRRRLVMALLVAPAVAGTTLTPPAAADDPVVVAANQGLAGAVTMTQDLGSGFRVNAGCTFAGVLTPANTLVVEFGGSATASGPANSTVPLITAVQCEVNNASEGGSNAQTQDFALNGPATVTASSTLLATSGPKEWPVMDITVCVSAFAIWGPVPVRVVTTARVCATP